MAPVLLAADEDGDAIDEAASRLQHLLDVPLGRLFTPHGEVADDNISLRVLENLDDIGGRAWSLGDHLREVLAEPVVGHAPVDRHPQVGNLGKLDSIVLAGEDSLREVLSDLFGVNIKGAAELDVADVITAKVHVHQSG